MIKYVIIVILFFAAIVDAEIEYRWTRQIGGDSGDDCKVITKDFYNNIYVGGYFSSASIDFGVDFGTTDYKSLSATSDAFFTKINNDMSYGYTKVFTGGGGGVFNRVNDIISDTEGYKYVAGYYKNTIDFGAEFGSSDYHTSSGQDGFIIKVTPTDSYAWTKSIGGGGTDSIKTVALDNSGNIIVVGQFENSVNFASNIDGGTDSKTSAGSYDCFVTKFSKTGSYGWTHILGGTGEDDASDIFIDSNDNIYVCGKVNIATSVDFGSDFGVSDNKTGGLGVNSFITKILSDGSYGWTRIITNSQMFGITGDNSGNIYITGYYQSEVDFGWDFGTSDKKSINGGQDIFITKITTAGEYVWTKVFGSSDYDSVNDIQISSDGSLYIVGAFRASINFGADFGETDWKNSNGDNDIFLTKINSFDGSYIETKTFGAGGSDSCNSIYLDDTGGILITGIFRSNVNFAADFGSTDLKTSMSGSGDIFITSLYSSLNTTVSSSSSENNEFNIVLGGNNLKQGDILKINIDNIDAVSDKTDAFLSIKIYSITGRLIKVISNKNVPTSQTYTDQWTGRDTAGNYVSSGMYILTVSINNVTSTKKIFWMR